MDKLYTCDEIAERYRVKKITVWDWIRKGKLSAIKVGSCKCYRISENDLKEFEERCRAI